MGWSAGAGSAAAHHTVSGRRRCGRRSTGLPKGWMHSSFSRCGPIMEDPWELRHRYIHVLQNEMTLEELVGEVVGPKADRGNDEEAGPAPAGSV